MKNLLFVLLILVQQAAFGQQFSISGQVLDEQGNTLPGATVSLQQPWGDPVSQTVTKVDGSFQFDKVEKGGYAIVVKAIGFESMRKEVTLSTQNETMGKLTLFPDAQLLKEVNIKSTVPLSQQRGDTTEYNSAAFKVMKDANSDELIEKIPGVTVENGAIKAQGDNVQQVLVDGKPFFGNDPTAALKSLPAEVVDKIQIFDQQSDQSQFTGVSDGNTVKTINIVTKPGMRNGQFGKVYAGYGYSDKYQAGGNMNMFDGDRRISFIGMTNNINVQNFATEDILGVMGMSGGRGGRGGGRGGRGGGVGDFLVNSSGGIATTHAIGLNYTDQWGKKTDVSASYFFNNSINNVEQTTYRQFINDSGIAPVYDEFNGSNTDNTNHRFNARININLDSMNSLMIRPRLTLQLNDGLSSTLGQTALDGSLLSSTDNIYKSNLTGTSFSNALLWRHKFSRKGRTVSVDMSNGYNPKKGESLLQSIDNYNSGVPRIDSLNQQSTLDINSWNISGNLEYTEPLTENSQLLFNARASYQQEASDKYTYDFFAPDNGYTLLNEPLTNVFSNDYKTQQVGTGYNYSKGRDLNFNARVNAQWAQPGQRKNHTQYGAVWARFFQYSTLCHAALQHR
ncbi:MAG: TonB-dependent receptor [Lewinellaceae bacterium]|nr:TonB-dependent receptor [Lewinellaceae bacterium]